MNAFMNKGRTHIRGSRQKGLLTGLILILLLSTYELVEDCYQYRLSSVSLQLIHAPPYSPSSQLSDQERVAEENRETIQFHILVHSALVVIASAWLLGVVCKRGSPECDTKEESEPAH